MHHRFDPGPGHGQLLPDFDGGRAVVDADHCHHVRQRDAFAPRVIQDRVVFQVFVQAGLLEFVEPGCEEVGEEKPQEYENITEGCNGDNGPAIKALFAAGDPDPAVKPPSERAEQNLGVLIPVAFERGAGKGPDTEDDADGEEQDSEADALEEESVERGERGPGDVGLGGPIQGLEEFGPEQNEDSDHTSDREHGKAGGGEQDMESEFPRDLHGELSRGREEDAAEDDGDHQEMEGADQDARGRVAGVGPEGHGDDGDGEHGHDSPRVEQDGVVIGDAGVDQPAELGERGDHGQEPGNFQGARPVGEEINGAGDRGEENDDLDD